MFNNHKKEISFSVPEKTTIFEIKDKIRSQKTRKVVLIFSIFTIIIRVLHYLIYPKLIDFYNSMNLAESTLTGMSFYIILSVIIIAVFVAVISIHTQDQQYKINVIPNGKMKITYFEDKSFLLFYYILLGVLILSLIFLFLSPLFSLRLKI